MPPAELRFRTVDRVADVPALAGYTIGITADRRREELGTALERRGAKVVYGPAIQLVPLEDDTQLLEATRQCLAAALDYVVVTTGIGFRGWIEAAETWGMAPALIELLGGAQILARGPKARGAIRAAELREAWSPESESSHEVLEHMLANYELDGQRVAVQLHGEPLPDLVDSLRAAGANVIEVPVYRWVPPEDEQPLRRLIEATATASLDCVTFTSAPAAANFLRTADDLGVGNELRSALKEAVLCVAVGPVTAEPLVRADVPVVQPDRFRLGALVREVVEQLPARAQVLEAAGHRVELRGSAVVVDDQFVPLPGAGMTLLRELASRPGQVHSREALGRLLPGESSDGHAVEVAIARLRTALGDPAIVQTVVKRGYRLAVEVD